jgi:hypothetical protein
MLKHSSLLPISRAMSARRVLAPLVLAAALLGPAASSAAAAHSVGTPAQIAWVRSAATRFVDAELAGNGADACAVLNAPLRATRNHRTCAQRQDARIANIDRAAGERRRLLAERRAIASAAVVVHGSEAQLALKTPLLNGPNHFLWTEMCWMLKG